MPALVKRERLALAVFAAQHADDERTWGKLLELWNEQHPGARREGIPNFTRDCHDAYFRVTGKKLQRAGQQALGEARRRRLAKRGLAPKSTSRSEVGR
jgi:hypothetical protein